MAGVIGVIGPVVGVGEYSWPAGLGPERKLTLLGGAYGAPTAGDNIDV